MCVCVFLNSTVRVVWRWALWKFDPCLLPSEICVLPPSVCFWDSSLLTAELQLFLTFPLPFFQWQFWSFPFSVFGKASGTVAGSLGVSAGAHRQAQPCGHSLERNLWPGDRCFCCFKSWHLVIFQVGCPRLHARAPYEKCPLMYTSSPRAGSDVPHWPVWWL